MIGKNDELTLRIDAVANDGNGVGRYDGMAVFVPASVDGDLLRIKIVKTTKNSAFGIITEILAPSPFRIKPDCPSFGRCGGCSFRQIDYLHELRIKRSFVVEALRRIGGFSDASVSETAASPLTERYRNKAQLPVFSDGGVLFTGFYARRSHRAIRFPGSCMLEPESLTAIADAACEWLSGQNISAYDEARKEGLLRHILLRQSHRDRSVLLTLIVNGTGFPGEEAFARAMMARFPNVSGVLLNRNQRNTNVILGDDTRLLAGENFLYDTLAGVSLRLSAGSFFQINHGAAEILYQKIMEYARPQPAERILDLYCGVGSIGLALAHNAGEIIGAEILPEAVEDAKHNAGANGIGNAEFFAADASAAATELVSRQRRIDTVITDPPRKGCDKKTVDAISALSPKRVVMVSCNPATLARDLRLLAGKGYRLVEAAPVDMFPRTAHTECVALLELPSKRNAAQDAS